MKYNPNAMDEENPIVNYWKTRKDVLDTLTVENALTKCRNDRYTLLVKYMNAGRLTRKEFNQEVEMLYGCGSNKEY